MSMREEQMVAQDTVLISLTINGRDVTAAVPARMSLAHFVRDQLALTGTHVGCDQGVCGACTVLMDGRSVRACLLYAVQAHDRTITTVEGLAHNGALSQVQQAFIKHQALQCGFCTPGFVMLVTEFVDEVRGGPVPDRAAIQQRLAANICRCTGYTPLIDAVEDLVRAAAGGDEHDQPAA